jgi:hypothetical protein
MGWARRDIEVIDTDLGVSGKWGVAREGSPSWSPAYAPGRSGAVSRGVEPPLVMKVRHSMERTRVIVMPAAADDRPASAKSAG